jgi:Flp pilus assembly protein TadG
MASWRALHKVPRCVAEDARGVAAVELAILAPLLALMALCTIDLGLGIFCNMQVQNAAQSGAQYAILHGFDQSSISSAVQSASNSSDITASPAPSQFCGCSTSTTINSVSCGSTCSGGGTPGTYVTVSAQRTYTPLLSYPLIPPSFTLTAQATVRIQ